jgi:hypothetical protein
MRWGFARKFLNVAMALAVTFGPVGPVSAMSVGEGTYFFRYKGDLGGQPGPVNPGQSKDITAFYIGGVGDDFSERLPMKPQWEDDTWSIKSGSLPPGISFNSQTLTFEGKPTSISKNISIDLVGRDANNVEVATGTATFDIYELPDTIIDVDFYGHTGKFTSNALKLPDGITIEGDPKLLSRAPAGIIYNARYFEGTPTTPGNYPVVALGYDYLGNAVVAFKGHYTVEDGPTFRKVKDDLREILWNWGYAPWFNQDISKVARSISGSADKVRYYIETLDNARLPGTLSYGNDPFNRQLTGGVWDYYSQVNVRLRAVDTDGTEGYSNWFRLGSVGPQGICKPPIYWPTIKLNGVANSTFPSFQVPSGADASTKNYRVVAGRLPGGLTLDPTAGTFSGTPSQEETRNGVMVEITFPGNNDAQPVSCGPYDFHIAPASISLNASGYSAHYRVGSPFSVKMSPAGGLIEPYSVTIDTASTLPETVTFNPDTGLVQGLLTTAGRYTATFRLKNGDGVERTKTLAFTVHDPLSIEAVNPAPSIAQYDSTPALVSTAWDQETVIGTEKIELIGGPLPDGFSFDGYSVVAGGTRLPVSPSGYGPFLFRLSDSSGSHVDSNSFRIVVTERAPLGREETKDLNFSVNLPNSEKAFGVKQTELAKLSFPLRYELSGPALPAGLSFNEDTGAISGTPTALGSTSGYTVTATEVGANGLSETSDPFAINLVEPPPIPDVALNPVQGNVNGPSLTTGSPAKALLSVRSYLVGNEHAVSFQSFEPQIPGLSLDAKTGIVSGQAIAEFNGTLSITYKDEAGRPGKLQVPLKVYPYPQLASDKTSYDIPRLSNAAASDIKVRPANNGFFGGISWSVDPTEPLPNGMTLRTDGDIVSIVESTQEPVGSVRNVVLIATSKANGLQIPFALTLKTVTSIPFQLDVPPDYMTSIRMKGSPLVVSGRDHLAPSNWLKGSFAPSVTWSLHDQPGWMSINTSTGEIIGNPNTLGSWTVSIRAVDKEGTVATSIGAASFKVRATLDGEISITEPSQTFAVRNGEYFETREQTIWNKVDPTSFQIPGLPSSVSFDSALLQFKGNLTTNGKISWELHATDADDRTLPVNSAKYQFNVTPALSLGNVETNLLAQAFSPSRPIYIVFSPAENEIGTITYGLFGDLPGTLYYKTRSNGLASYSHYNDLGGGTVVTQKIGETEQDVEARLPFDKLIFDVKTLSLKGIANAQGTFPVELVASDSYQDSGYLGNGYLRANDPTRIANNTASTSTVITVDDRVQLALAPPVELRSGKQYDSSSAVFARFAEAANSLGSVEYTVSGDIPGTLYYRRLGPAGQAEYRTTPSGPTLTSQAAGETVQAAELRLNADHMVFDQDNLTFTGIPSVSGVVNLVLKAEDKTGFAGLANSPRNKAEMPFAFSITPADPLQIANVLGDNRNASAETVHQYTASAKLVTEVSNAAYGRLPTWTLVSGQLPQGLTASKGQSQLSYAGYATAVGNYPNIVWKVKDAAGREVTAQPVSLTVDARDQLQIVSSKTNPRTLIVFDTEAGMLLTGKNTAFGQPVAEANWLVSGTQNLPPGLTYKITPDGVTVTGKSSVVGTYTGFRVMGTDAIGASASTDFAFNVIANPAPIELNVFNVKTKVGFPVKMEPPFAATSLSTSNTYGKLRFYSYDIPTIEGIGVNGDSGHIDGEFETVQKVRFDLYVTDETDRVTSKPVQVDVIPNLRLLAPAQMTVSQGEPASLPIATDYALGTVTYTKGAGQWPEGLGVNPTTGAVVGSASAAVGTYAGLTIIGSDKFGTFTDTRPSNTFSISVTPIIATPVIADVTGNRMLFGKVGGAASTFTPTVTDSRYGRAWNYPGTVYSINHDLSQFGLNFDTSTGKVSGTPTSPGNITDLVITVKSASGDTDSTQPFWFGISPEQDMVAVAGQRFTVRKGNVLATEAPKYLYGVGSLTYKYISGNSSIGVNATTGSLQSGQPTSTWTSGDYPMVIRATDELGRNADASIVLTAYEAMDVQTSDFTSGTGAISGKKLFTVTNSIGTPEYTVTGLPQFLTFDPTTQTVSGTVPQSAAGTSSTVTVLVKDSVDDSAITKTLTIRFFEARACIAPKLDNRYAGDGSRFWFVSFWSNVQGGISHTGAQDVRLADLRFYDSNGDCYIPAAVKTYYSNSTPFAAGAGGDGDPATVLTDGLGSGIWFDFGMNVAFDHAEITMVGNTPYDLRSVYVCHGSGDGWGSSLHAHCSPNTTTFAPKNQPFSPGQKFTIPAIYPSWNSYGLVDVSNAN